MVTVAAAVARLPMKHRFTSLDVRAMVLSLEEQIKGYRVNNVYDLNPKTYLLKLSKPDSKLLLLLEAGVRMHTTVFERDKGSAPSGFTLKLRKHLKGKRVESVSQLGSDRIIVLKCGAGEWENSLVIELYDKGNVLLTDPSLSILTLLRNSKHDADSRLTVGDAYPMTARQEVSLLSKADIAAAMQAADAGTTAKQLVMKLLPLGKDATDHTLLKARWPASSKMSSRPWEDVELLERIEAAMSDAHALIDSIATQPGGIIVIKPPAQPSPAATAGEVSGATYDDFAPFEMAQHAGCDLKRFASFSEAVDDFFSRLEVGKAQAEHAAQELAAWKKVDKIKQSQDDRVGELRNKEAEDVARAGMIEMHAEEIDALLALLRNGVSSGMDWSELQELIDDSARDGDELASMVHSLDLAHGKVTLALTEEDDDADEEALTRPATLVKLDMNVSALANARSFYTQKKAAAVKTAKTLAAAEHTVKAAEKKAAKAIAQIKVKATIRSKRTPFWWEKFDWCVSSENLLILCAKDAHQSEMLVRRHLRARDVYIHADVPGAPVCVVKHSGSSSEIPPLTLSQAGCAVLSRSDGWSNRVVTSAWWVAADAVTKDDPHGGRFPPGVFGVKSSATRIYLPPSPPVMGFGILFRVSLSSVAQHADERRVRGGMNDVEEAEEEELVEVDEAEADEAAEEEEATEARRIDIIDDDDEEEEAEEGGSDGTVLRMLPGGGFRVTAAATAAVPPAAAVDVSDAAAAGMDDIDGPMGGASGEGDTAADGEDGGGAAHKPNRLTAKQRRLLKKGKLPSIDAEEAADAAEDEETPRSEAGSTATADSAPTTGSARGSAGAAPNAPSVRGKTGKLKKLKGKYADQDEDDRQLYLDLLGSAGKSKRQLKAEESAREAAAKAAEAEARKERQAGRVARDRQREQQKWQQRAARQQGSGEGGDGEGGDGGGADEEENEDTVEDFTELEQLLAEPSIAELPEARRAALCAQDTLTAVPSEGDELMYALPVCAPYSVLASYTYKIKLTPGSSKKGRAAKHAVGLLSAAAPARERELMRAVTDDELVRAMLANVKVAAPAKMLQQQKSAEKRERKERATERAKSSSQNPTEKQEDVQHASP